MLLPTLLLLQQKAAHLQVSQADQHGAQVPWLQLWQLVLGVGQQGTQPGGRRRRHRLRQQQQQ